MIGFEEVIADLKRITLKDQKEIVDFVRSNKITYSQTMNFYLKHARFPNKGECELIFRFGIDSIL